MRAAYGSMSEHEILYMNWEESGRYVRLIMEERREARRWELHSRLAASAAAFGGEMSLFNSLRDATLSPEEIQARVDAEEAETQQLLEADRAVRKEAIKRAKDDDARRTRSANWLIEHADEIAAAHAAQNPNQEPEPPVKVEPAPAQEAPPPLNSSAPETEAPLTPKKRILSSG